jgi:hypothetical protein
MRPVRELKQAVLLRTHKFKPMLSSVGVRTRQTTLGTFLASSLRDALGGLHFQHCPDVWVFGVQV